MNPADLAAELDRRQRVIDDLRAQLAQADAEAKRLRAHLDWWQAWGSGVLAAALERLAGHRGPTPDPDDTAAGWDEANLGGTA